MCTQVVFIQLVFSSGNWLLVVTKTCAFGSHQQETCSTNSPLQKVTASLMQLYGMYRGKDVPLYTYSLLLWYVNAELAVTSLSYTPNGAHLAVGLASGEVQVFDIESSSCIFTLEPHNEVSRDLSLKTYLNAALDKHVMDQYFSFFQYPSAASALAYSENGQRLAVGHRNGQIQIWRGMVYSILGSVWLITPSFPLHTAHTRPLSS